MNLTGMIPYNVRYEERLQAKKLGMLWYPQLKIWLGKPGMPYPVIQPIFFTLYDNWPEALPGEDRSYLGKTLLPAALPTSLHGKNFRAILGSGDWRLVSHYVLRRAKNLCEICGAPATDCHESFFFHFPTQTASVLRLQALCADCHGSLHWGRTGIAESEEEISRLLQRMLTMSHKSKADFNEDMENTIELFCQKEKIVWQFNESFFGLKI